MTTGKSSLQRREYIQQTGTIMHNNDTGVTVEFTNSFKLLDCYKMLRTNLFCSANDVSHQLKQTRYKPWLSLQKRSQVARYMQYY